MSRLSPDERALLVDGARHALGAVDFLAAARAALDGAPRADAWPIAVEAGWPGLLVPEPHGGAGLGATEALLVSRELGRVLAGIPLLGHLTATALLTATGGADPAVPTAALAAGTRRAAWLPTRREPGGALTADRPSGPYRNPGPELDGAGRVSARAGWVPDAPEADLLVLLVGGGDERRRIAVIDAGDASIEEVDAYDGSRRLAHVTMRHAQAILLPAPEDAAEACWALAQALLGAESLGAAERLLERSVEHARRRVAFGRAIGSFQAVKHQLVEVLRRIDNAQSLMGRAGDALDETAPDAYLTACALRFSADDALDLAARTAIAVHGGMGATWEHPAALYFRRAQVARRLLAGHGAAATEVGRRLLTAPA